MLKVILIPPMAKKALEARVVPLPMVGNEVGIRD